MAAKSGIAAFSGNQTAGMLAGALFFLLLHGTAWSAEPQKIRFSFSSRSNSVIPFQVAVTKGFFKEEGLEVEMIQMNPRLGAIAVMNGDTDFTTTFGSTLRAIVQDLPLKFVAVSVKKSEHFLVVRPDIKDVKDLKGKRLGVSTLFGTDQTAAEEILRNKGLDPSQVQVLALGDAPVRAQALAAGLVEASSISPPHDLILKAKGFNVLGGPQDVRYALPTSGIAVANKALQERSAMVKRAVRALLKAHRFVFENRQETIDIMMNWLQQSRDVASRSYEIAVISIAKDGEITDQEWERLTQKKRPLNEVRDFSLLTQAQRELGLK